MCCHRGKRACRYTAHAQTLVLLAWSAGATEQQVQDLRVIQDEVGHLLRSERAEKEALARGAEGLMLKAPHLPYVPNAREHVLKLKGEFIDGLAHASHDSLTLHIIGATVHGTLIIVYAANENDSHGDPFHEQQSVHDESLKVHKE